MAAYDVAPTQPAERRTTLPCSYQMCQAVAVAKGLAWARVLSLEARRPRHCLTHERTPGGISSSIDLGGSRVSLADVLWVLPVLVGLALGWSMRSRSVLALLLGAALVVVSFVLFGYSIDHYENGDCQGGAPCPTGEHIIEFVEPGAFLIGAPLIIVSFGATVWNYLSALRRWRSRRA